MSPCFEPPLPVEDFFLCREILTLIWMFFWHHIVYGVCTTRGTAHDRLPGQVNNHQEDPLMRYLLSLMLVACLSVPVMAAGEGTGFQGPVIGGGKLETVRSASKKWDDSHVTLIGNIVSRVAGYDDIYMFRDATGTIMVEIDEDVFQRLGSRVTPETSVRISGEVDKEFLEATQIDVDHMEIVR